MLVNRWGLVTSIVWKALNSAIILAGGQFVLEGQHLLGSKGWGGFRVLACADMGARTSLGMRQYFYSETFPSDLKKLIYRPIPHIFNAL